MRMPRELEDPTALVHELAQRLRNMSEAGVVALLKEVVLDQPVELTQLERDVLDKLRRVLTPREWAELPQLVVDVRAGLDVEIEAGQQYREAAALRHSEEEARKAAERTAEDARLAEEQRRRQRHAEDVARITDVLRTGFLEADSVYAAEMGSRLPDYEYEDLKVAHIRKWIADRLGRIPDDQQSVAIGAVNGNVQVVARAGSGKTSTIVNRALFLHDACGVAGSQMLLLAFNRKAASEIEERLEEHWDPAGADLPHTMTFHSLAHSLVRPTETLVYDREDDPEPAQSTIVQDVLNDLFQSAKFEARVKALMLDFFRADFEALQELPMGMPRDIGLAFRRALTTESLRGDRVKSYGEKVIANFLFENGVTYAYEKAMSWGSRIYRPDFTIARSEQPPVIIEYFGLRGDPSYDQESEEKRKYLSKKRYPLIPYFPGDVAAPSGRFTERLRRDLEAHGVTLTPLSEDDIWERCRRRAILDLSRSLKSFISRCRQLTWTPDDLRTTSARRGSEKSLEGRYLSLAQDVYSGYLARLEAQHQIDFSGLMQAAVAGAVDGSTGFNRKGRKGDLRSLRYVFIDEYQDFSALFLQLIQALREQNPSVELFCVGDDWQAINSFAGADLQYFQDFSAHLGPVRVLYLDRNYRSATDIVDAGNDLMAGHGRPAVPAKSDVGKVVTVDVVDLEPDPVELATAGNDRLTLALTRLSAPSLLGGGRVHLLARTSKPPESRHPSLDALLFAVREAFPKDVRERISISTTHKFKGREADSVILIDADRYPLIHPYWIFEQVFGTTLDELVESERRLLYVAMTRAKETLVLLSHGNDSMFAEVLRSSPSISRTGWAAFPRLARSDAADLRLIRINDGYPIKDLLKSASFGFSAPRSWQRSSTSGFRVSSVKDEVWSLESPGVTVEILDGNDRVLQTYRVTRGNWVEVAAPDAPADDAAATPRS